MDDPNRPSNGPLVTVVTPSFNQGRFIRDTIESVLSQDYPNLEYMVIDGGSTDDTLSILKSYEDRFAWLSEPDHGQAHAINKGWRCAKGEILAWINSDDIWLPGAIETAVDYLVAHPELEMVYGEANLVDTDGQVVQRYPTYPFVRDRLCEQCGICQPTVFLRRSVVGHVGYLNESLHYCMDYEFWIRVARQCQVGTVPFYLAHSRWHDDCKTIKHRVAAQREVIEMLHDQYGCVHPRMIGFSSREFVSAAIPRALPGRRLLVLIGTLLIGIREFWRYNRRLTLSQWRGWQTGIFRGFSKIWRDT